MRADATRVMLPALIAAMSATAWVALWQLGDSPWGAWIHAHGSAGHHAMAGSNLAVTGAALFIVGWVVMTVAMMLPATLPLVNIFQRLTAHRRDQALLVLLVVVGYLAAWAACGALVFGASVAARASAASSDWLTAHPRLPAAGLFLVAGTFQFSPLKYQCLDRCRTPFGFVTSRWRGARERWQSFRIGLDHGLFCVGCCWALMLLMFAFGTVNLLWMLVLGAIMALEKNASWGRRLAAPVGVLLIVSSLTLVVWPA